jgi:hypothetical protein
MDGSKGQRLTPRQIYLRGKIHRHLFNRKLDTSQNWCTGPEGREDLLLLLEVETQFLTHPARSLVTSPSTLTRLLHATYAYLKHYTGCFSNSLTNFKNEFLTLRNSGLKFSKHCRYTLYSIQDTALSVSNSRERRVKLGTNMAI